MTRSTFCSGLLLGLRSDGVNSFPCAGKVFCDAFLAVVAKASEDRDMLWPKWVRRDPMFGSVSESIQLLLEAEQDLLLFRNSGTAYFRVSTGMARGDLDFLLGKDADWLLPLGEFFGAQLLL